MKRARLFLDANILISAAWKPDSKVLRLWRIPDAELVTSSAVVDECFRNTRTEERRLRLETLLSTVRVIDLPDEPQFDMNLPFAEKDLHVMEAAILFRCDFLVTGDRAHFGAWFGKQLHGVQVEPPNRFPAVLETD